MKTTIHRATTASLVLGAALLLGGCAGVGSDPGGIMDIPAPEHDTVANEVIGQGTVIQQGENTVQLCMGPMTMIYPPNCSGPEVVGWDWDSVDGATSEGTTTWGTYAVQGVWDGERLTLTQPPIMLALYDPIVPEDPYIDPANPGGSSESELNAIQSELGDEPGILGSYAQNGYLFVEVIHDNGALQSRLDTRYGEDVVVVRSQLQPIG